MGKIMLFLTLMAFCTTKEVSGGLGINENQFYLLLFFPGPCTQNVDEHWEVKCEEKPMPALKGHPFSI